MKNKKWAELITQCRTADQHKLKQQTLKCASDEDYAKLEKAIQASSDKVESKKKLIPTITYPANLPVSEKHKDIAETISKNQVTIIAGETGSGKTTQLPKICLNLGLGTKGLIGHTQPRRIAARTVAARISEEIAEDCSKDIAEQLVAYQVRFHDSSSDSTAIKLMTDGVLLSEIKYDRFLNKYDTIIIDEAHERSLNIDFLLGYLKILCKKRNDIKIIITSATIDVEKFAKHFEDAPIIQVSGRTFPVEVFYTPVEKDDELNKVIVKTIKEIINIDKGPNASRRDILIFCTGEREIRQAALAISKAQLRVETVPLYARLSLQEQNKAFASSPLRKVILATNVAETSITVPNVGFVIDPGFARISRYSHRSKIQRLPIEAISQASANQRKGRCGRVADGICFRLYEEDDFIARPEFTEAEILRSNLAAVILKMIDLRLGDVREFPFLDIPDERLINDGYKLLEELQAVNASGKLTKLGKIISQLPIDPRYGRILIEANDQGCLSAMLIIISALSCQDPREYPSDKKQAAEEKHKIHQHKKSDFITYLNLWAAIEENRKSLSNKQFKQWCSENFINFMRTLEWRDLHRQLIVSCKQLKWKLPKHENKDNNYVPESYSEEHIHRSLLTGLLGNIANLDYKQEYQACRNRVVHIFPASGQFKKNNKWLVANEFLETSKVYAHGVASINPDWVLKAAAHLVKRSYFEPYYDKKSGLVNAYEKTTLYGLTLVEKKSVYFGKIDPIESRKIFIREALVAGKYQTPGRDDARFYKHNRKLVADIENLESKTRRRNLLVDDQVLIDFYDARIPEKVVNLASFERWRMQTEKQQDKLLFIEKSLLLANEVNDDHIAQFPDSLDMGTMALPLHYHFEIGHKQDGLSLQLPIDILHQCPKHIGEWLVPGLLQEKCIVLIRLLPKELRRTLVPIPETVIKILPELQRKNESLHSQLAHQLKRHFALDIKDTDWQLNKLDEYYQLNYQLIDKNNKLIDQSRNLIELQSRYKDKVQKSIDNTDHGSLCQEGLTEWNFDELPKEYSYKKNGLSIQAYPYLNDQTNSVAIKLSNDPLDADYKHLHGVLRLACLDQKQNYKYLNKEILSNKKPSTLAVKSIGDHNILRENIIHSAILQSCFDEASMPRTEANFKEQLEQGRSQWLTCANQIDEILISSGKVLSSILSTIEEKSYDENYEEIIEDIQYQIEHLFSDGFIFYTPIEQLKHYPRYLKAIEIRLDKAMLNYNREIDNINSINEATESYYDLLNKHGYAKAYFMHPSLLQYRHMFEEWRVSLFAQQVKTAMPVSLKRIDSLWDEIFKSL